MSSHVNLPIDIYDVLERHLGHEDSRAVAKAIEQSLERIESRSMEVAEQRKREVMEQMRNDLATKEYLDLKLEATRMQLDLKLVQLDKRFTFLYYLMLLVILIVNREAVGMLLDLLKASH